MTDKKQQNPVPDIPPGPNQSRPHDRLNDVADEMAERARRRQERDESGDLIVETDPHGSTR